MCIQMEFWCTYFEVSAWILTSVHSAVFISRFQLKFWQMCILLCSFQGSSLNFDKCAFCCVHFKVPAWILTNVHDVFISKFQLKFWQMCILMRSFQGFQLNFWQMCILMHSFQGFQLKFWQMCILMCSFQGSSLKFDKCAFWCVHSKMLCWASPVSMLLPFSK